VRLVIALLLASTLACGNKSASATSRCAEAAQKGVDAMVARAHERANSAQLPADVRAKIEERTKQLEATAPRLRAVITNRCVDDKWPAAVIDCYAKVTSMDESRACRATLSPEQQAKVQKEELDLFAGAMGPPGFGSGRVPSSPEIARLEAELREQNAKLAAAAKKLEAATTEVERQAAKGEMQGIQQQMQAINDMLAAARANAAGSGPAMGSGAGSGSAMGSGTGSGSAMGSGTGSGPAMGSGSGAP